MNISNAAIQGLVAVTRIGPQDPANTAGPADISYLLPIDPNGVLGSGNNIKPPGQTPVYAVSYNNLYWPGGFPASAAYGWNWGGGHLEVYGVAFTVNANANTYDVDVWFNGYGAPPGYIGYGAAVIAVGANGGLTAEDYVAGSVPEPSTWALMGLGFVGLAFAGFRARRAVA